MGFVCERGKGHLFFLSGKLRTRVPAVISATTKTIELGLKRIAMVIPFIHPSDFNDTNKRFDRYATPLAFAQQTSLRGPPIDLCP